MTRQLRLPEIDEFEKFLILEKQMKIAKEEARNLEEREDDFPTKMYVKRGPVRIIKFEKNADLEWEMREEVVREEYDTRVERWVRAKGPTELVEYKDFKQFNRELLPVEAFVDQGTSMPKEPKFTNDRKLQRECIVGKDNKLLAFHLKVEEKIPYYRTEKWIIENFECSIEDALRLSEIFKELNFNITTITKLIEPVKEDNQYIDYLEALAEELPTLPRDMIRQEPSEIETIESEESLKFAYPGESLKLRRMFRRIDREEEEEEEKEPKSSTFGLHPLHYEEDGCSHEFLTFLRFATIKEIKGIMKGFFKQRGPTGIWNRARFWYLTPSQRAQAWIYINERRRELGIYQTQLKLG